MKNDRAKNSTICPLEQSHLLERQFQFYWGRFRMLGVFVVLSEFVVGPVYPEAVSASFSSI